MAKATTNEVDELHGQVAKALKDAIKEAAASDEKKGYAALLNVARQFLKDNNVTAALVPDSPLKGLADELPFAGDEEFGMDEGSPLH